MGPHGGRAVWAVWGTHTAPRVTRFCADFCHKVHFCVFSVGFHDFLVATKLATTLATRHLFWPRKAPFSAKRGRVQKKAEKGQKKAAEKKAEKGVQILAALPRARAKTVKHSVPSQLKR